jgi:phosphatidylinositol alpha-1,6-mannosyltransferase
VLALVTDGFGASGGIAQYNQNLLSALVQPSRARRVIVVPRYASSGQELPAGIQQAAAAAGVARWSLNAARLAARGFDIIFCGHLYAAPLAVGLAGLTSKPLWLQAHGIEAWQAPSRAVRFAVERAQLITAVSRYTRKRLLEWANIDPSLVRVLPNAISTSWSKRPKARHLRTRYNLDGKRVILTVSRLSAAEAYKGHDRIISALPEIIPRHDAAYLVVGGGDDVPRLEALAAAAGVADRVHFAGHVTVAELPDHFAVADVFAMPSTGEGFGIVFIEAAASGLPVIAGNRDGSVDALADGRIGRLIDPDDRKQLVAAIIDAFEGRLHFDPSEVRRFTFAHFSRHVNDLVECLA